MRRFGRWTLVLISLFLLGLTGCASFQSMLTGEPSYAPQTYGTEALIKILEDDGTGRVDGIAAASELTKRSTSDEQLERIASLLKRPGIHPETKLAIIELLKYKNAGGLKDVVKDAIPYQDDQRVAAAAVSFIVNYLSTDESVETVEGLLSASPHPLVRYRSASYLSNYPKVASQCFVDALKKEDSATTAYVLAEFLVSNHVEPSLDLLKEIANDIERKYDEDDYSGSKCTANDVRAIAVQGVEQLSQR